jgi:hypothetical protein
VPVANGSGIKHVKVRTSATYSDFLDAVSSKMGVSKSHLSHLGYVPSYLPKNPKPIPVVIETEEGYEDMVNSIEAHVQHARASGRGQFKGKVKDFTVRLSDMSEGALKERAVCDLFSFGKTAV